MSTLQYANQTMLTNDPLLTSMQGRKRTSTIWYIYLIIVSNLRLNDLQNADTCKL
jgi:hypothetical protein